MRKMRQGDGLETDRNERTSCCGGVRLLRRYDVDKMMDGNIALWICITFRVVF
jgi:hypothetical protein